MRAGDVKGELEERVFLTCVLFPHWSQQMIWSRPLWISIVTLASLLLLHYGVAMSLLLAALAGAIHAAGISGRAIERTSVVIFAAALVVQSGISVSDVAHSARTLMASVAFAG